MRLPPVLLWLAALTLARAGEPEAEKLYKELRTRDSLEAFLRAFPKGGDLHNHMGAAITPEKWIEIAIQRNFCLDERQLSLVQNLEPACPAGTAPASRVRRGGPVYNQLVEAMSMRVNRTGPSKGHDYFFQRLFRFVRVRDLTRVFDDILEPIVVHAHEQNMTYLELQISAFRAVSSKIAESLRADGSLAEWLEAAEKSPLLHEAVSSLKRMIQRGEGGLLERRPAEAAAIRRRYLITAARGAAPPSFFAQLAAIAELARVEPRVAGMNIAGAEDGAVALRDFRLHMRMIDFIRSRKPWLRVTLHAGELTPQILRSTGATPEALTFHIAESVWHGSAERIGHGTALRYEKDRAELLRAMRERGVLVEICLTSAELIQDLTADGIPFAAYRQAGVPVSINTDDEGFLGTDLSREFLRAARDYNLRYTDLKELARNSIEYSFLPGGSLFRTREFTAWVPACSAGVDSPDCRAYLGNNPKAETQARLEHQFQQFESSASLKRF